MRGERLAGSFNFYQVIVSRALSTIMLDARVEGDEKDSYT